MNFFLLVQATDPHKKRLIYAAAHDVIRIIQVQSDPLLAKCHQIHEPTSMVLGHSQNFIATQPVKHFYIRNPHDIHRMSVQSSPLPHILLP